MSHVYQPLLISFLVQSGGAATVRQLAQEFALADEASVLHYEKRIKEMPDTKSAPKSSGKSSGKNGK
jgi:hypothetical protein